LEARDDSYQRLPTPSLLTVVRESEIEVDTPFGKPSDKFILADVNGVLVVFLPRHGRGHVHNPSEVNYRANIFGMKLLGVKWLIGVRWALD
jgi:5'-methylthioadenosine phosphorylase